jgi:4-amino-4-deoxy-L-arabinose transferase-like glycosyltransferase
VIKKLFKNPLLWIFLLALILRIYKLNEFPVGFHVDEVKVGWNALSILKTGQDDWGKSFALYYNSFGDFRPTGIFYATIPSLLIFGRNEFAVRFPSALFGALTIFPLYFFVKEILKNKLSNQKNIRTIALLAPLLLAVSPWHMSVSRATSEVIISLFFALSGLVYFLKGLNQKNRKFLIVSFLLLILSYFFYHSVRILAPMFILMNGVYYWKTIKEKKLVKAVISIFILLSLVTLLLSLDKEARGRFSQVSIFNDLDVQYELSRMPFEEGPNKVFIARLFHNKPLVYTRRFINEYTKYFSSNFYLESTTPKPARYQTVGVGLSTYIEFVLLILGLIIMTKKKQTAIPLLLLLLAPIPAALTTEDAPNLHRALFMIPFLMIIEAYGFNYLISFSKKYQKRIFKIVIFMLGINFIFFLHMYYVHNRVHLPLYRNVGVKELALRINEVQKDYDQIILTNIPDDPYPWIAFLTERDPSIFNKDAATREKGNWTTENFVFSSQRCPSRNAFDKPEAAKLLVIDAEGCATESNLINRSDITLEKIYRPDGSEVYNLWSMKE